MRLDRGRALLGVVLAGFAAAGAQDSLHVRTDKGEVVGKHSDDGQIRVFLGIPYGAPPVGPLRWRPPQQPAAWSAPLVTQNFGHRCMQPSQNADMVFHDPGQSEDCLTVNVWAPPASAGAKLPVMVWIYGGGFTTGATSERRQDGEAFAHKGVILVSMNYRLGAFGFLALPELAAESPQHAAGNYGLMDQAAALQWTRRNVAAFGGDPANITLFGESAGSFSVSAQMASPLAKDLLAHAIGESGGAFSRGGLPFPALPVAEARGTALMEHMGKRSLAELRAVPAEELLTATSTPQTPETRIGPDVDGLFLPEPVPQIYAEGKQAHIPLMAGWNHDEGSWMVTGRKEPLTMASYGRFATDTYGPQSDAFLKVYGATNDQEAVRAMSDWAGDQFIAAATWEWIEAQGKTGDKPVYRYRFDQPSPGDAFHKGTAAFHSDEIEYVFGQLDSRKDASWTPADYTLSGQMQDYWINFAKTGDPNGAGLPQWPKYDAADEWQVMHLDATPAAAPANDRGRYEFLRTAKALPQTPPK